MFPTGERYILEDNQRFATEQACKDYGEVKGAKVMVTVTRLTSVVVSGGFNCSISGEAT